MAYVVADPCVKCKYTDCVAVCPVDCFYEGKNSLAINPDECIDCGACEPECPWQAIFEEVAVPDVFKDDTPLNYAVMEQMDQFKVAPTKKVEHPTAEQVAANKVKWGWTG